MEGGGVPPGSVYVAKYNNGIFQQDMDGEPQKKALNQSAILIFLKVGKAVSFIGN